ncbi:MAG: hypothetical protein NZM38_09490 [Cytophagales bacterium]|nr:hypothetical protein [Cytophagales bacterium]MDW8384992.1 glycoside hydrolase family 2 TIM barrel-domain containing protein [Flammeovirgaceae bacterium]
MISFNEYIGWYGDAMPDACQYVSFDIKFEKPVIVSEFGADALYGFHGDSLTRWSEEYQENVYIQQLAMLRRHAKVRGITPWLLVDFRSPRRNAPFYQDGWNRKGVYSELGDKKRAFYVLKRFYEEVEKGFK